MIRVKATPPSPAAVTSPEKQAGSQGNIFGGLADHKTQKPPKPRPSPLSGSQGSEIPSFKKQHKEKLELQSD